MELICEGLQFPTSVAFDGHGNAYVAESGLDAQGRAGRGRVLRIERGGAPMVIRDDLRAPINGLTATRDGFYVAEGGTPGRIGRLGLDGSWTTIHDGLPGGGSYHTNMVAVGPDGRLYFGQAAATNSGVIGYDDQQRAWPRRLPADIPGFDVVLRGVAVRSAGLAVEHGGVETGAFAGFGEASPSGTRIRGALPCTAAVLRCQPDGSELELVAWGLRNAYGLGFREGRLLALELGANDRGARPIAGAPSCLYAIEAGAWYGWPDFVAGVRVDDPRHASARGPAPQLLLANHDELPHPPEPLLRFPLHAAPVKFAIHPGPGPFTGQPFIALFGDKKPFTAPPGPAAGRAVVRVDLEHAAIHPVVSTQLHRPIDLAFHPDDRSLWVLDFGDYEVGADAATHAVASSGRLWRVPA